MRGVFKYLDIPVRTGYNVTTNRVRKFRSDRVLGNKNPWYDWTNNHNTPIVNGRGYSGFYKKLDGTYVFLRSSWEYIYAKWLDKNNINWKIEEHKYKLKNGEWYRPDFFIYENKELTQIVEIKGFYKNRRYKARLLRAQLTIPVILIEDVRKYTFNMAKDIHQWKNIRLKERPLKK